MREIKFRALSPNKNAWWYSTDDDIYIKNINGELWLGFINEMPMIIEDVFQKLGKAVQYTGLKDKNGVEIFEGDIVLTADKLKYEVVFDKCCYWLTNKNTVKTPLYQVFHYTMTDEKFEVIGNIYENHELLGDNR